MSDKLLKGAPVAAALNEKTLAKAEALRARGIEPTLAVLRVGEREDDLSYERGVKSNSAKAGVSVRDEALPVDVSQEELMATIERLNNDNAVHGVLMFRPLPKTLDEEAARRALRAEKDVDGITDRSLAGVFTGSGEGFAPCTPSAVVEMLDYYGIDCKGARMTVIGRSLVVGKPLSMMLLSRHATVTICHTRTADLPGEAKKAEILIAAAGKASMVDESFLSPGQTVLDVGINVDENGKLCGDVKREAAEKISAAYTPVPGGVGSVTSAVLMSHVVKAAEKRA